MEQLKKWGAVILVLIWIALIALVSGQAQADVAREQALCVTDKEMAQSIQFVRITTRDNLATYSANVVKWSKPGKAVGHAQTPEQIAIKDHFWQRNLAMAVMVYELPVGWSPEYVGNYILKMCQWKFEIRRWQDEKTQKYEL